VVDVDMFNHVTFQVPALHETHVEGATAWRLWAKRARVVAAKKAPPGHPCNFG
jgi:hypothetical protein